MLKLLSLIRKNGICCIPKGTVVHGGIDVSVPLYVYGTIYGEVKAGALVYLGNTGSIVGNVYAARLVVYGQIQGEIMISGEAKMMDSANITGNISASPLVIDKDARIDGQVNAIHQQQSAVDNDTTPAQPPRWI